MSYTEQDIDHLRQLLATHGFQEPFPKWIAVRVQSISFAYEELLRRREANALASRIDYARDELNGIWHSIQFLDRWGNALTAPTISDDPKFGDRDVWSTEPPRPLREEEFSEYVIPADFTDDEIETTRRVLYALAKDAERIHQYHVSRYQARPVKNERPEVTAVIGGFARIWCQAMKIPESEIAISSSAGSPAMNFIEAGAAIFLPKMPQRETIERHVIAYRNEKRAMLS